ncbi:hypothetical protein BGS_1086 [Beggiatoa sp. SS]|nr:hypothetical protein BGS_1086 [Beggiatoa sp. SS]
MCRIGVINAANHPDVKDKKFRDKDYLNRSEFLKMSLLANLVVDVGLRERKTMTEKHQEERFGKFSDIKIDNLPLDRFTKEADALLKKHNVEWKTFWGLPFIKYAVEHTIMGGYDKTGEFGAGDRVKRDQAAKILTNVYCYNHQYKKYSKQCPLFNLSGDIEAIRKEIEKGCQSGNAPFYDVPLKQWFCKYVRFAKKKDFIQTWVENNDFKPGNELTRGEMASAICRLFTERADINSDGKIYQISYC